MADTINQTTAKGIGNRTDTTNRHYFFRSNFNMPVKNIDSSWASWLRYTGPYIYYDAATSFDCSTLATPGYEIFVTTAIWDFDNTGGGSSRTISAGLYYRVLDTDGLTLLYSLYNNETISSSVPAGSWKEYKGSIHFGADTDEINENDTYYSKAWATGTDAISTVTESLSFTNVPTTARLGTSKRGFIWIEGNNLAFVNWQEWKHELIGTQVSTTPGTAKAGYIWIDGTDLHWVGANGYDYKASWKVKQFASSFSNSSTSSTFAGTSKYGFIWVDDEFGGTHLAYIASDGYKYLTGAGDDPYV